MRNKETAEKVWVSGRSPKRTQLGWEATSDNNKEPQDLLEEIASFLPGIADAASNKIRSEKR